MDKYEQLLAGDYDKLGPEFKRFMSCSLGQIVSRTETLDLANTEENLDRLLMLLKGVFMYGMYIGVLRSKKKIKLPREE